MGDPTLTLPAPEGDGGADKQLQQAPPPPPPPPPGAKADPPATVATRTRSIGIIHPPRHIRAIIEKTATFVAKNGPGFERRVISDNQGNANFSFLRPSDPYHAYYQHRVSVTAAAPPGAGAEPDATPAEAPASAAAGGCGAPADGAAADSKAGHSADSAPFCLAPPPQVLVPPKAELFTVRLPEGITGEELDIIKLTSQFVARNGKKFLTSLAQRESNDMQFHFIRPMHSMFPFLTSLTEACPRVLKPEEGVPALIKGLREGSKYMTSVLEGCLNRLECELSREQARQQAEDEIEQEQMQMSVVVETIEFGDDEYEGLLVPPTLEEFKRRKRVENLGEEEAMELEEPATEVEMQMDGEEMQLVKEGMMEENDGGAQVKVAGDDRIAQNYKKSDERIPAERDTTKFVVSLVDPKYKEQKARMLAGIKEMTLAPDDETLAMVNPIGIPRPPAPLLSSQLPSEEQPPPPDEPEPKRQRIDNASLIPAEQFLPHHTGPASISISVPNLDESSQNIVGLACTRSDIFGTMEGEVSSAIKAEIEKKKDEQPKQAIWDGHSGSIGRTATDALSPTQHPGGEEQFDLHGPAPLVRPGMPLPWPPHPPPLVNVPRFIALPAPYLVPPQGHHVPRVQIMPHMHPQQVPGHPPMIRMLSQMVHIPTGVSPHPGHIQFMPGPQCSFPILPPPHMPHMVNPIGIPQPSAPPLPPQPPEEQPPPPDEPEPKMQRIDDASLIPAEQFLAHHPGPASISVSVPNLDEGNLRGQVLQIPVQSLSDTIGSLKKQIAGELQLPANKQKLSLRTSFLKDNLTLAYYNVGPGVVILLTLKERGGRKKLIFPTSILLCNIDGGIVFSLVILKEWHDIHCITAAEMRR
ncbi:hypothetical protein U9M48_020245 [Paspalum notatum var. saurae]|uniref:Splicing factor 3A subunit 1 n=1 Tax=Paspalum notatum var. saurae TaxID=547442 RepID=A0AAQ3TFN7_PASNO